MNWRPKNICPAKFHIKMCMHIHAVWSGFFCSKKKKKKMDWCPREHPTSKVSYEYVHAHLQHSLVGGSVAEKKK